MDGDGRGDGVLLGVDDGDGAAEAGVDDVDLVAGEGMATPVGLSPTGNSRSRRRLTMSRTVTVLLAELVT